jgi:hypothetical protein
VRVEATILISGLVLDQLFGPAGTIRSLTYCRIDRQPPPSGGANIQIQLNGVANDSSIGTCVIGASVIASRAGWPAGLRQHQDGWLLRKVRIALTRSLNSLHIQHIIGSFLDIANPPNLTPRQGNRYASRRGRGPTIGRPSEY